MPVYSGDLGIVGPNARYLEFTAANWYSFRVPKGTKWLVVKAYGDGTITTVTFNISFGFRSTVEGAENMHEYKDGVAYATTAISETNVNPTTTANTNPGASAVWSGRLDIEGFDGDDVTLYFDIPTLTLGTATKLKVWIYSSRGAGAEV